MSFLGFRQLDAGRRKSTEILQNYIKILKQMMTNPCKIDARKSNAKNMENDANMEPKWRSTSIKNI